MNSMNSVLFRTGNWQWQWEVLSLVTLVPCDLARCVPIQKKICTAAGQGLVEGAKKQSLNLDQNN